MKTLSSFILGSVLVLATVLLLNPLSTAQGPPRGPLAGELIPVGVVVPSPDPQETVISVAAASQTAPMRFTGGVRSGSGRRGRSRAGR